MAAITPAEVRALAGLVDELDYYQLLEIERDAPASAVKRGYYAVTRRLHPDANRALASAEREVLEGVARRVSEAYQVLRDGRRRRAYDAQLAAGLGRTHAARRGRGARGARGARPSHGPHAERPALLQPRACRHRSRRPGVRRAQPAHGAHLRAGESVLQEEARRSGGGATHRRAATLQAAGPAV